MLALVKKSFVKQPEFIALQTANKLSIAGHSNAVLLIFNINVNTDEIVADKRINLFGEVIRRCNILDGYAFCRFIASGKNTEMNSKSFIQQQYSSHALHFNNALSGDDKSKLTNTWFDTSTADYWRHIRAFECAELLANGEDVSWVTIGDGRWGLDSIRIKAAGHQNVLPTDISEFLLNQSKSRGFISSYSIENAEKLNFTDGLFDYAFCKESFHHFPRPYLALYEMLRVSKKGAFLIEPNDPANASLNITKSMGCGVGLIKNFLKILLGRTINFSTSDIHWNGPGWEVSGNYVYGISKREAEKIALGINLPQLLIKGLNDFYIEGCEFEPADEVASEIFKKIKNSVQAKDLACKKGEAPPDLLMLGFMHQKISADMREKFIQHGWEVIDLPPNPYI